MQELGGLFRSFLLTRCTLFVHLLAGLILQLVPESGHYVALFVLVWAEARHSMFCRGDVARAITIERLFRVPFYLQMICRRY